MSDGPWGPDDPLSGEQVATAVTAARPDWRLRDCEPIHEGSDVLYRVSVTASDAGTATDGRNHPDGEGASTDGEPERNWSQSLVGDTSSGQDTFEGTAVLKCFRPAGALAGRSPARFLTEVRLQGLAGEETTVPVPAVYGVCESREGIPTPCYLMEHVPGVNGESRSLDVETARRVARQAGRYLARIHDWRSFDAVGELAVEDGDVVAAGPDRWATYLRKLAEESLADVDGRFGDLAGPAREYARARFEAVEFDVDPVLLHGDYRLGNFVLEPDSATIEAVLDWGASLAGDRLYELVWVEADLADEKPPGSERRRRVRGALYDAYEAERGVEFARDASFDRRLRLSRFVKRVTELRWFDYWYHDWPERERRDHADRLRATIESTIEDDAS